MSGSAGSSAGGGLGYLLVRASQLWRGAVAEALRPHGLTVPQFLVLVTLRRRSRLGGPPVMQRDLVAATGIDANTTSQVLRTLVERGLISRDPHPGDQRAKALALSEAGQAAARDAGALVRGVNASFFATVANREDLATELAALISGIEHAPPG